MKVAIAGTSGFIGSALMTALRDAGHQPIPLVRREPGPGEIRWDPDSGTIESSALEGVDAVVNLAGENITGRWSVAKKQRIRDSRLKSAKLLSETLAALNSKPRVYLCASAVGIYGDRNDEILTEDSAPGSGFFGELGVEWEARANPASESGIRVVHMRFGILLDRNGGALKKMLTPFRLGVAGPLGSGRQYMSWISLEDGIRAIFHLMMADSVSGPVNVVSPNPVTNREFTRSLAAELKRPAIIPVPAFALRLIFGEMADEALLSSARAHPARLQESGFQFRHPDIKTALHHALRG